MKRIMICLMSVIMVIGLVSAVDYSVRAEAAGTISPGENETDIILKPTATPEPTAIPTIAPTETPTIEPTATSLVTETPAVIETISPTETEITPTETSGVVDETITLGEVNDDGNIDAKDALDVLKHAAKLVKFDESKLLAADVTGDGKVDASDALEILKYSARLIDGFKR